MEVIELNSSSVFDGVPVIDFHAHAFPDKIVDPATNQLANHYELKVGRTGTFKDLMASAEEAGIAKICMHMAATNEKQVEIGNTWIAEHVSENVIGFGSLHVNYKNYVEELERMENIGISGIKFHADFQAFAIDDPKMWPIYEAIGDRFLVMFHVGDKKLNYSSPIRLKKVLENFPSMKIIAAHLGGYSKWDEAEQTLLGKNLWIDTSSTTWCLQSQEIARIIRCHDSEKVLFGTDYPIVSHRQELEAFSRIPLTEEEQEKILYKNGDRLLGFIKEKRKV